MAKKYPGPWILRTLLFSCAHDRRHIARAWQSPADSIVLDLEDAVPEDRKQEARSLAREVLESELMDHRPVFVRINPADSGLSRQDLDAVACRQLAGFVYPKAASARDVAAFSDELEGIEVDLGLPPGHFDLIVLIETPQAVLEALAIAGASSRVIALLFGCEDFLSDMQGAHGPDGRSLLVPRHLVAMAARARGIIPIDTPFVRVHDAAGLADHIHQARELGFEGMLVLSPAQIEAARSGYSVSAEEHDQAREILAAAAASARGICVEKDHFVAPPTVRRARNLLQRHADLAAFEQKVLPS